MDKMKQWSHKISLNAVSLEPELNAYAEQGYEIFRIWQVMYDKYEIVAYKEIAMNSSIPIPKTAGEVLYMDLCSRLIKRILEFNPDEHDIELNLCGIIERAKDEEKE